VPDTRQRTGYLFLAMMIGHIILISAQVQSKSGGRVIEAVTFSAFSEIQRGTASVFGGVGSVWSSYFALRGLKEENDALKREMSALRLRLQQEQALARQSEHLQRLLDLRSRVGLPTTAAEVIGGYASPDLRTVTINKGIRDGVRGDAAVLSPAGVVGRVLDPVAPNAARVQLLISRNAGAGAMVERTRAGGVVIGGGIDPPLSLEYVSNLADVEPGDLVVTAGTDGIYPKGFPIGLVETVERGAGLHKKITVRPVVDFSNVEEVLVLLSPPAPEGGVPADPAAGPGGAGR
jgi:rod shape-determining protein MreC